MTLTESLQLKGAPGSPYSPRAYAWTDMIDDLSGTRADETG